MSFPTPTLQGPIGLDIETRDPKLRESGPGDVRKDGYIVGVSVASTDGFAHYYPVRHEGGGNYDRDQVWKYLNHILRVEGQPKVGANISYDIGWLWAEGVDVKGPFLDVQIAEALIDEYAETYALDHLGRKYIGEGKCDDELYQYLAEHFGGKPDRSQAKNIWRAPAEIVRSYAEWDAAAPLEIFEKQILVMDKEGTGPLFKHVESPLIPLLVRMRQRGVRVNVDGARDLDAEFFHEARTAQRRVDMLAGGPLNVGSNKQLGECFDRMGLTYPRTAKGNPSFTAPWLAQHTHPIAREITKVREYEKLRGTFIQGYILDKQLDGRVHGTFNQVRGDEYGARPGRMSSSQPNLQNIPGRTEEGKRIRSLFIPDEGHEWWRLDWSQIEYRFFVHYSRDEELIQAYTDDAQTDFHAAVGEDMLGGYVPRKIVKNFNFMMLYGGGHGKLVEMLRAALDHEQIHELFEKLSEIVALDEYTGDPYDDVASMIQELYAERFPSAKELSNQTTRVAKNRGYIKTILGRRSRFPFWEKRGTIGASGRFTREEALNKWGGDIQRNGAYKALNYLLQGSAADLMKKAMVEMDAAGIFDVIDVPLLTVHDELAFSIDPHNPRHVEAGLEGQRIMEHCMELRVPVYASLGKGANWGEAG